MWCYFLNGECNESEKCDVCNFNPYYVKSAKITCSFNYECPDCHGKFNTPAIPGITSSCICKCPFCGRPMEGL